MQLQAEDQHTLKSMAMQAIGIGETGPTHRMSGAARPSQRAVDIRGPAAKRGRGGSKSRDLFLARTSQHRVEQWANLIVVFHTGEIIEKALAMR